MDQYTQEKTLQDEKLFKICPKKGKFSKIHRLIGALTFLVQGKQGKGSAMLLSKNSILTTAHNIYTKGKGQHTNFKFYLASFGQVEIEKYYEIESWKYPKQFQQGNIKFDYAIMKLKKNQKMPIMYKNYCELFATCNQCKLDDIIKMELLICGYPLQLNYNLKDIKGKRIQLCQYGLQKQERVKKIDIDTGKIEYQISTLPGQSGCPVINQGNIIAIHIGSKTNNEFNVGRLLTFDVLQNLKNWNSELKANKFVVNSNSICEHYRQKNVGEALLIKGKEQYSKRNYECALKIFQQCLKIRRQQKDQKTLQKIEIINWICGIYILQKRYREAIDYYKQLIQIYQCNKIRDINYAMIIKYLGFAYKQIKDYKQGASSYKKCLQLFEELKCQKRKKGQCAKQLIQCLIGLNQKIEIQFMQKYLIRDKDILLF